MALTPHQTAQIVTAAKALGFDAPIERADDFAARVLGFNAFQRATHLDPNTIAGLIAKLSNLRVSVLQDNNRVPNYAMLDDGVGTTSIAGLSTYLALHHDVQLVRRFSQHVAIRDALVKLGQGQNLEALAAAIMHSLYGFGQATRGTGDQGIDSFGSKELARIDRALLDGIVSPTFLEPPFYPGENVFLMASSKAIASLGKGRPALLSPAHIRELVGGWTIQRSPSSAWGSGLGLRSLSPLQLVLVTTYRMSLQSRVLCHDLGVQVWGIPQLIFLVCKAAPAAVFDAAHGYTFASVEFRKWWKDRDINRRTPG